MSSHVLKLPLVSSRNLFLKWSVSIFFLSSLSLSNSSEVKMTDVVNWVVFEIFWRRQIFNLFLVTKQTFWSGKSLKGTFAFILVIIIITRDKFSFCSFDFNQNFWIKRKIVKQMWKILFVLLVWSWTTSMLSRRNVQGAVFNLFSLCCRVTEVTVNKDRYQSHFE